MHCKVWFYYVGVKKTKSPTYHNTMSTLVMITQAQSMTIKETPQRQRKAALINDRSVRTYKDVCVYTYTYDFRIYLF